MESIYIITSEIMKGEKFRNLRTKTEIKFNPLTNVTGFELEWIKRDFECLM